MQFRRRAKFIFASIFALVTVTTVLVQTGISQEMRSVEEHTKDSAELGLHKNLYQHIVNAVLAQRAFLISGKEAFLTQYAADVSSVPQLLDELSLRHTDEFGLPIDPEIVRLWASLKLEMDETISLVNQGDVATAFHLVGLGYGAEWMAQLQTNMRQMETEHSVWHKEQADLERTVFGWASGSSFVMLVAILGLLGYVIRGLRLEVFRPIGIMREHFGKREFLDEPIEKSFRDQELDGLRLAFNNLTIRASKHKEEMWAESQSKLNLQVKLTREQEEFSSVMAHEVRTPLSTIRSLVDLQKINGKWPQDEACNQIDRALLKLTRLVDSSLEYRYILAGENRVWPVSFNPLALLVDVKDHCAAIGHPDRDRVQFDCNLDLGVRFEADAQKITHILINLVSNGLKFSPPESKVSIAISMKQSEEHSRLYFSVIDRGIGMTEEECLHIFEPFTQASSGVHRKYGGTGLGLAISKRLADCMQASLSVSSFPGHGTRFILDVPVKLLRERHEAEIVPAKVVKLDLSDRKVLMVEDHHLNAKINSRLFNQMFGCSLVWAESMEEAIRMFDEGQTFNLILMDINLGSGMSGLDGSRLLHSRYGSDCPPIVALTAGVTDEQKSQIYASGMRAVIAKPFSVEEVSQILSKVLHCKQEH